MVVAPSTESAESNHARGGERVYGLDILRAYAILTVLYAHSYTVLQPHLPSQRDVALYLLPSVDGVTTFFVLSGFLIGSIILRMAAQGRTSFADVLNFWRRRWMRTLPNYMLVLGVLVLLGTLQNSLPDGVWKYALFVQNFATPHPGFFGEAWSLSVEEWFYLLFPLVLFGLLRVAPQRPAHVLCFALFLIAPVLLREWRVATMTLPTFGDWGAAVKTQVLTRQDSIVLGVVAAYLLNAFPRIPAGLRHGLLAAGIALLAFDKYQLYVRESRFYVDHFTLLVTPLAAALMLPQLREVVTGSGVVFRFLTFTSKISYALYLVHFALGYFTLFPLLMKFADPGDGLAGTLVKYALFWLLAYGLAYLMTRFFEQPLLRLRDRLWPDTSSRQPLKLVPAAA